MIDKLIKLVRSGFSKLSDPRRIILPISCQIYRNYFTADQPDKAFPFWEEVGWIKRPYKGVSI